MKLRCRVGLHAWWPWSAPVPALRRLGETWAHVEAQSRTCSDCGRTVERRSTVLREFWLESVAQRSFDENIEEEESPYGL